MFISGYSDSEYIREALRLKAVDYVYKPIRLQEVERGDPAERRPVAAGESLIVVPGGAEALDGVPDGVFPVAVLVGEQFLVDSSYGLLDAGRGVGGE